MKLLRDALRPWMLAMALAFLIACAHVPQASPAANMTAKPQGAKASDAILAVHHGDVWVNGKLATPGMELHEGDAVKTGEGSEATVVFFDSSVLRLSAATAISITKVSPKPRIVQVKQLAGDTWTRLLRISGVVEYGIETPNTIATVRGTAFAVSTDGTSTRVRVKDGAVRVAAVVAEKIVAEQVVTEDHQADVEGAQVEVAPLEPDPWVAENVVEDQEFVSDAADQFADEHKDLVDELRAKGFTDERIGMFMQRLATGDLTEEEQRMISPAQGEALGDEGIDVTGAEPNVTEPPAEEQNASTAETATVAEETVTMPPSPPAVNEVIPDTAPQETMRNATAVQKETLADMQRVPTY